MAWTAMSTTSSLKRLDLNWMYESLMDNYDAVIHLSPLVAHARVGVRQSQRFLGYR